MDTIEELSPKEIFSLHDKTAMVIGAGGLGKYVAFALSAAGAVTIIADKEYARAESVAQILKKSKKETTAFYVDILEKKSINKLVHDVTNKYGIIDCLIIASGVTTISSAFELSEEEWDRIINTNLKGSFLCCQIVGQHMKNNCGGSIILFSSQAGLVGMRDAAAYCASKGGINQLTKTLALEWADYNIRINAVAPTWFETEMLTKVMNSDKKVHNIFMKRIENMPLKRLGNPKEIVGAIQFLSSDASSMITGSIFSIDGGYTAQ